MQDGRTSLTADFGVFFFSKTKTKIKEKQRETEGFISLCLAATTFLGVGLVWFGWVGLVG